MLCVAVMFCSVSLMAQPQRPEGGRPGEGRVERNIDPVEMAEKQTNRIAAELGLNEKQKKSLLELNKSMAVDMKAQAEARRKEREELEAKRKAEQKAMTEKMNKHNMAVMALLNDEQKIEYALMLSKMKGGRGGQGTTQMGQGGQRGQQGGAPRKGARPEPNKESSTKE